MTDLSDAIKFEFEVRQVKTMVDGTVNVTLNLPEYCVDQAAKLLLCVNLYGSGAVVIENPDSRQGTGYGAGRKRKVSEGN